jgi:hypothetical protein
MGTRLSRIEVTLGALTLLYVAAFGALAVVRWNYEFVFYGVVLLMEIGCVVWLHRRVGLSNAVLLALASWGLLHMAGGTVPIPQWLAEPGRPPALYNLRPWAVLPKYDQVVHAYGFGVATWAAGEALRYSVRAPAYVWGMTLTMIGMGLGALNEVIEFAATRLMPGTNVGGYDNTGWDLVSNLTGAFVAALWFAWSRRGDAPASASV